MAELITGIGLVTSTKNDHVNIKLEGGKTVSQLQSAYPLRKGDVICFSSKNGRIISLHSFIICRDGSDLESITRLATGNTYILNLIRGKISAPHKYLDSIASLYRQCSGEKSHPRLVKFFSMVGYGKEIRKFLDLWFGERLERKLKLIGLTSEEINNIDMPYDDMFDLLNTNIWNGYFIHTEKCIIIAKMRGQQYNNIDIRAHCVANAIFRRTSQGKFVGIYEKEFDDMVTIYGNIGKEDIELAISRYDLRRYKEMLYLPQHYIAEQRVGKYIGAMIQKNHKDPIIYSDPPSVSSDILLSDEQRHAVWGSVQSHVCLITGGPGTGKTHLISLIYKILTTLNASVMIAAFTGKTVANINKIMKKKIAITMDMAIVSGKIRQHFRKLNVLIVDEVSMITIDLFNRFIEKYNQTNFRIILVGDINQLEPIGWGGLTNSLRKIEHLFPVFRLTYNYRTAINGNITNNILSNASRIITRQGHLVSDTNFQIYSPPSMQLLQSIVTKIREQNYTPNDFIILSPYSQPTKQLNSFCQQLFNKHIAHTTDKWGNKWAVGDKVRSKINDYESNIMNGQEGHIIEINWREIVVDFSEKECRRYPVNGAIIYLELSYAITIHLSQGSEWNVVILYIPPGSKPSPEFLNSRLLYTAITRARRWVFAISSIETINAIALTAPNNSIDHLDDVIQDALKE